MKKTFSPLFLPVFLLFGCVALLFAPSSVKATTGESGYILPDSSTHTYTADEISDMSAQVLCYAKNEIYARHGRKFLSKELTEYFEQQSWYQGTIDASKFSENVFNDHEMKNVMLLTKQEKAVLSGGYVLDQKGYSFDPVYDYVSPAADSGINASMSYNKDSHELSCDYFSVTIPDEWIGKWSYLVGKDSVQFCCKAVRQLRTGYNGTICTLLRSDEYREPDYYPSSDYLGDSIGYYYYLLYPTDVQFDPDDPASIDSYYALSELTPELIDGIVIY